MLRVIDRAAHIVVRVIIARASSVTIIDLRGCVDLLGWRHPVLLLVRSAISAAASSTIIATVRWWMLLAAVRLLHLVVCHGRHPLLVVEVRRWLNADATLKMRLQALRAAHHITAIVMMMIITVCHFWLTLSKYSNQSLSGESIDKKIFSINDKFI